MASPPRLLSIAWNLIRGGTEGQCARVAMLTARSGCTHRVAVFRREGYFVTPVEEACGAVYPIRITRMLSPDTWREIRRLRDFIRAERIDVVHAWDCDAEIFGSMAARWAGVPYITSRRDMGQIYPPYKLWLMHRADAAAHAVVVNAGSIARYVESTGIVRNRIVRIPNVMDVEEFDQLSAQSPPANCVLPEGRLVGMIARLDPEKDVATFLRAGADVLKGRPDVHLVVAGDGPDRAALEELVAGQGMVDRVRFLGDIAWAPQFIRRLSVGVLTPKANEGMSNTILEYMAGALPVVATDCGGNAELVEHEKNGLIVPIGDVSALAGALGELLDQPERARRMGEEGRRKTALHSPEAVGRRFMELYVQAASSRP